MTVTSIPQRGYDRDQSEGITHPADGHDLDCWDSGCDQCELHIDGCDCYRCDLFTIERGWSLPIADPKPEPDTDAIAEYETARLENTLEVRAIGDWYHDSKATVEGKSADGLRECLLLLGIGVRYNVRGARTEIRHESFDWTPLNDRMAAQIRDVIAKRFQTKQRANALVLQPLTFGRDTWMDALNAVLYENEIDPFQVWLENLPKWDKVKRLDSWLTTVFVVNPENETLGEWASRFICLGTVWRTYHPGTKLDELPVLIGRGGIGKSTALRYILPLDMPDLFSDGLNLGADVKQRAEALQGRAIVEASEMAGVSRADVESLKAFITRTDDGNVRLAYRQNPERMLRRCVIIGTADRQDPLPNDRNLRRFVPVELDDGNPQRLRSLLDRDRDQIWAEALVMFHKGIEARLPDGLADVQADATAQHRSRDVVIEDAVDDFIRGFSEGFTMSDIASGMKLVDSASHGATLTMRDQHRIGAVLVSRGYVRRQTRDDGRRAWRWYPE